VGNSAAAVRKQLAAAKSSLDYRPHDEEQVSAVM
jgi:hypothetical protein